MATALPACHHGAISRRECEELLGKKKKDGAYLIRDSETIQGALCLCVYKQKIVYTYRLLQTHTGSYTLLTAGGVQETFFKTLDDLIGHYKRKNQGLAVHLRHAVNRKTAILIRPSRPHPGPESGPGLRPHPGPESGPGLRPHPGPESGPGLRPHPGPESGPGQIPERGSDLHGDVGPDGPAQGEPRSPSPEEAIYENASGLSDYEEVLPD